MEKVAERHVIKKIMAVTHLKTCWWLSLVLLFGGFFESKSRFCSSPILWSKDTREGFTHGC